MAETDDRTPGEPAGHAPDRAPDRAAVEYAKCLADCAYFIDTYCVIDDTQGGGDGGGTTRFRLWPAQIGVVWQLMTSFLVIILKARQLGISWLCCGYALWHCLFQPGKTVLLFSQGQDEANELLRRVRVLYERLPAWLRDACPLARPPNTSEIEWANGSRVKSLPATRNAGSGWTASLVVMDEAAKIQFADDLYTAMKPTIDNGGQLVILSTAKGVGSLYHRLWVKAAAGLNSFRTIFLPWWSRPGRDAAWYAAKVAEADDPATVKQEYPASSSEAFLVSGRTRFHADWVAAQAAHIRPGLPRSGWPESLRGIDGLTVYEPPPGEWHPPLSQTVPKRSFAIGADVAEGLEHGDYSAATLIDAATWEELACLHGHPEPDEFAVWLKALSDAYGAEILVERNNHGHAVLSKLKSLGCKRVAHGPDKRPGWLTNAQTKPQAIDALAVALRDGLVKIRTQAALDEMQVYRVLGDGKTGAPERYHDDRVMAFAIAMAYVSMSLSRRVVRFGSRDS